MIITLCGSARFERLFKAWNEALTMAGHTVFTLTAYPSDKAGVKQWYTDEQKVALDAAHLRKIDASDAIFVLNKHAYIGESTLREVDHARRLRKTIYFLESWGQGCGVGSNHTDEAQHAVIADGLTVPTASPMDTTTRTAGVKCPWASSLLGPGGPLRSAIVALTKAVAAPPQPAASTVPATDCAHFGIIDPDYARIFTKARILAWSYGYACVAHGSFTRDLDLLLVPWTDQATADSADRIIRMIVDQCDLKEDTTPADKPHGRRAYSLHLKGFGEPRWVDVSVIPIGGIGSGKGGGAA